MRKLKLQVQMTVDGFVGGPAGEMDWVNMNWDNELVQYVQALTDPVDTIVLGRKLAEGFIPYWSSVASNREDPQFEAGKKFTETKKVVFTKTLQEAAWSNTVLQKGALAAEINKLKNEAGGDIIAYGGALFVSSLIVQGLVDEYHLFINPTAIGNGLSIFKQTYNPMPLTLVKATTFSCGIVAIHYTPKNPIG
jgi:dihydrofolate reductase